jgi:plasmid segregation protein ParM
MYGASKAHWYTEVRVLLSIYRYAVKYGVRADNVSIVVGQPYVGHTDALKAELKAMLQRSHAITVNGANMTIAIKEVGVAPEGVGAYWGVDKQHATCKVVDVGSGTVNAISFEDYRVTNYNSDTLNYGTEVITDMSELAIGIIQDTTALGWTSADRVLICGGSTSEILPYLKAHYRNAEPLSVQPKYANAVGFYTLATGSFR